MWIKFMNQYIWISKTERTASCYELQQQVRNELQKFSLAVCRMLLKQHSVLGSSQRSTNPLSPLALLGQCYREDALHPGSSGLGLDFLADLPKPYNFSFRIYCRSYVSVPCADPGGLEEGVALWSWCRRSAVESSVSHTFRQNNVCSNIVLSSTKAFFCV